jgi:hypothetical protein
MSAAQAWYVDLGIPLERYCIISGLAIRMIPGDRCRAHGAAPKMCDTDIRPAS